jgi:hypothetical protein
VACKTKIGARLVTFFHDCMEVTAAIELSVYRAVVLGYGLWHLVHRLK